MSTIRQKRVIRKLVENGGNVSKAMRESGYKESTINSPSVVTKSKAFIKIMEEAGLTDTFLAKTQNNLARSARIERVSFSVITSEKKITVNKQGKKLKTPKIEMVTSHVPDQVIRELIESVPGHKLIFIHKGRDEKIAYFQVPEAVVQSKQVELALKVKGHFSPDAPQLHIHELTKEERSILDSLLDKNK